MKRAFLIVETPRAGDFGHRFLVPPGIHDERLIATIVEDAARHPVGRCHVAISRPATQRLDGGSVRGGSELIILAGIAGDRLTPDQLVSVRDGIKGLWAQVDCIVPCLTADDQASSRILVNRGELDMWFQNLTLVGLPNADLPRSLSSRSKGRRHWLKRIGQVLSSLAFLLLALSVIAMLRPEKPGDVPGPPKGPGPNPSGSHRIRADVERRLNELAKRWQCKKDDLASSICRASRLEPCLHGAFDCVLLESSSNESFYGQIQVLSDDDANSLVVFLPESDAKKDLQKLLEKRDDKAARRLRESLYRTWKAYEDLRHQIEAQGKPFEDLDGVPSGFRRSMVSLKQMELDSGLVDDFVEPVTPIFERQDAVIMGFLHSWLVDGAGGGLSKAFRQANVVIPDDEPIVERLKHLHKTQLIIKSSYNNELGDILRYVSASQYKGDLDPKQISRAYEAAERLIDLICNLSGD